MKFGDFVIDEKPVAVYRREEPQQPAIRLHTADGEKKPLTAEDFLSLIGRLLVEHESLIEMNLELERRPTGNEIEGLAKKFLTVFDSFERILFLGREFPQENEVIVNWLKSFESLYYRIRSLFEHYGLVEIKAIGKTVDLDFHEVVELRPSPDYPDNTVLAERQKGYIFQGKILRVAQVVVAQNS